MYRRFRRMLLGSGAAAALLVAAVALSAPTASAYGKATWQTAFSGSFTYPGTGWGFGFWGWCDFAGGVNSGGADCQISEYNHNTPFFGPSFNCELSIDATAWDESGFTVDGALPAFAVTGTAVVHPANLTDEQKGACLELFAGTSSTSFQSANTFIPALAGNYSYPDFVQVVFGATGELHFTVKQLP